MIAINEGLLKSLSFQSPSSNSTGMSTSGIGAVLSTSSVVAVYIAALVGLLGCIVSFFVFEGSDAK